MAALRATLRDTAARLLYVARLTRPAQRSDALLIVTFHRVLPEAQRREYPFPGLAVTPEEFAWFLDFFARHFDCAPVSQALGAAATDRPRLAITFDDGQLDNFVHARPALEAARLRATFYVPSLAVERDQTLWHDRIGYSLGRLARSGRTEVAAALSAAGLPEAAAGLPLADLAEEAVRHAKRLEPAAAESAAADWEKRAGGPGRPDWDGLMSWEQLGQLASSGHEIGSHSQTHALLPGCDDARLTREVRDSRAQISQRLGVPVESFCYPNGDCDDRVVAAVRDAGYSSAVTTRWGRNAPDATPLGLVRCDMQTRHVSSSRGRLSAARLAWRLSPLNPGPR